MQRYWSTAQEHPELKTDCELTDFLDADEQVETSGALTVQEITQAVLSSNANEAESDNEDEPIEERVPITGPAARQGYLQLRQFCEENGLDPALYAALDKVEDFLLRDQMAKMKQSTIYDFFTPR